MLEINNLTKLKINAVRLRFLTEKLLRTYNKSGALVSLAIVGPERMRRLNREYRGTDKPTDVLSFPAGGFREKIFQPQVPDKGASLKSAQPERSYYLGEIVINKSEAAKISKYYDLFQELNISLPASHQRALNYLFYFLFVHGLLHLLGHEDETGAGRLSMLRRGRDFLNKAL